MSLADAQCFIRYRQLNKKKKSLPTKLFFQPIGSVISENSLPTKEVGRVA